MTHRELCEIGARFLIKSRNWHFRCPYVLIEFNPINGESPDVYGLNHCNPRLIEVKVNRQDFIMDRQKQHRKEGNGIGQFRYYLCPEKLIFIDELPDKWGLLWCNEKGKIEVIKLSESFDKRNFYQELIIMQSVIRRLAGKQYLLDFRIKSNKK